MGDFYSSDEDYYRKTNPIYYYHRKEVEKQSEIFSWWLSGEYGRIKRGEVKYPKKAIFLIDYLSSSEGADLYDDISDTFVDTPANYYIEEIKSFADPVNGEKYVDDFIEEWFDDYELEKFYKFIKKRGKELNKEGLSEKNFKILSKGKSIINTKNDYGKNKKWGRF